jgi:putative hydrolase of the HAD superfamily
VIKGYIFDYGGTLDTGGQHWGKVLWHAYQRQQVPVTEALFREAYVHAERTLGKNPIIQPDFTFRRTLEEKVRIELEYLCGKGIAEDQVADCQQRVVDDVYGLTKVQTAHSCEVLLQLKEQYPMVLVSNFYGNIAVVLQEFGFDGLFQSIVESAVVGVRKPDPRIFSLGVEALELKAEEVVVVGDSMDKDIIPASKAGCKTVWFKGEGWTDDPVDERLADRVITDLTELLNQNR